MISRSAIASGALGLRQIILLGGMISLSAFEDRVRRAISDKVRDRQICFDVSGSKLFGSLRCVEFWRCTLWAERPSYDTSSTGIRSVSRIYSVSTVPCPCYICRRRTPCIFVTLRRTETPNRHGGNSTGYIVTSISLYTSCTLAAIQSERARFGQSFATFAVQTVLLCTLHLVTLPSCLS